MKKLFNITLLISLSFLLINCSNDKQDRILIKKEIAISKIPTENGNSSSIQDVMSKHGLKGLSVAVIEDYKIVWADSWGVKHDSIPLNLNTAFSTASISKPITATLFAILEEKGLIDLKAPVAQYLKRWKLPESEYTKDVDLTLEHLLGHTAGTTQHGFTDFYKGDKIPTILESVQGKTPNYNNEEISFTFKPGTSWKYSGGGYTIAMMALEDHLGKSLADLAQEYIFTPLKLQHTTMKQPNETGFLVNVAKVHDEDGNVIGTGIPITPQVSASGLWSTPTDMATFLIEIQKALNGEKTKVISQSVAKRITDIVTYEIVQGFSLGWERRYAFGNLDWFSHGGANTGVGGHLYATIKDGKGIVFFGNGPNNIRIPVLDILRDNIIKSHGWKKPLDKSGVRKTPKLLLDNIVGRYEDLIWGGIVEVDFKTEKLNFFVLGKEIELFYVGDNTFIGDELPYSLKFSPRSDGKTEIGYAWSIPNEYEKSFRKIIGKLPFELAEENKYEEALLAYKNLKTENPSHNIVQESTINNLGYKQLNSKNFDVAITFFKINTDLYSNSANAFDSLGEAYYLKGDKINALKYYKISLQLNPNNLNAKKYITELSK